MKLRSILNWSYIYLCLLIWAVETIIGDNMISPLHIDVAVLLMCFFVNGHDVYFWKAFVSGPIMIWGLWTVYSIGNWFICPYSILNENAHAHWYWTIFSLSRTYFMLVLLYYEACLNFPRAIKFLAYAFLFYFIIGFVGQWGGPMRDDIAWEGRNGTILGNHFPLNMLCSLFVISLGNILGYITRKRLYIWIGIVAFVIMWVATRKAMGGMLILLLFYIFARIKNLSSEYILKLLISLGVFYFFFNLMMDYTLVGQRMNEFSVYDYDIDVPKWLSFLGDRAIQYVLAWNVFMEHPLNGVGLGNSMDYTGLLFPIHSEYMEQLCEGGILGASLYLCFIISLFMCIYHAWTIRSHSVIIICLGGMVTLLFLSLTAWMYNMPCFFVIYALIIAYCNPIRRNREWRFLYA